MQKKMLYVLSKDEVKEAILYWLKDHQGVDFGEIEIPDKIIGETLTIELPQKEEDDKKEE